MHFQPGFLASIVVILLAARLLGELAQRLQQPPVIGQLVAGILLGPSFFGTRLAAGAAGPPSAGTGS